MNNFIKQVIEETFASKAQQRFFYAKANEKGASKKEKKKWSKWANEFSKKTDFDKIPDKKDEEVDPNQTELQFDEIVDKNGNIAHGKKPTNLATKGVTSNSTSDEVAKTGAGQMGYYGVKGIGYRRYWGESEEITKEKILEIAMGDALGYDATMGQDKDIEDAETYFKDELGLDDNETEERLEKMGYDKELPDDKVRLVGNPKKFMEEYIESILDRKTKDNEIVTKEKEQNEEKEINPIVLKQLKSLKNSLDSNDLSIDDVLKHLKNNE